MWVFGFRVRAGAHARAASLPGVHGGEKKSDRSHGTGVTDDVSRHARCWESNLAPQCSSPRSQVYTHTFLKRLFFLISMCVGLWKMEETKCVRLLKLCVVGD